VRCGGLWVVLLALIYAAKAQQSPIPVFTLDFSNGSNRCKSQFIVAAKRQSQSCHRVAYACGFAMFRAGKSTFMAEWKKVASGKW
jgi:hypothetical protein